MDEDKKLEDKIKNHYVNNGLFLDKDGNAKIQLTKERECLDLDFMSDLGFYINASIYEKNKIIIIDDVSSCPLKGRGLGRRMVEATELAAKELGLEKSYILFNQNPSFWSYMGYKKVEDFDDLKNMQIIDKKKVVYKKL